MTDVIFSIEFHENQLVNHLKFGDGKISSICNDYIYVEFDDEGIKKFDKSCFYKFFSTINRDGVFYE